MAFLNEWVGYLDRSYEQIKNSLIQRLRVKVPEITDYSESNILVIIIGMFAGLMEMLGYYIDNMLREAYIATARRFSSVVKLVKLLDYRIKAKTSASADITISFLDGSNQPTNTTSTGIIPKNTKLSAGNLIFQTLEDFNVPAGVSSVIVPFSQYEEVTAQNLGTTTGALNEVFSIGLNYVHDSIEVEINSQAWVRQNTLGLSTPTDKHFIVEIDVDGVAKVVFGDGTNGEIPQSGYPVLASYKTCSGIIGNVLANTITTEVDVSGVILPGVTNFEFTNLKAAAGGTEYEDLGRIKVRAPLSIRTLDRAVTKQDYEDIAIMAPGVALAKVDFDCGKAFDIYIAPLGGGLAQGALISSTQAYVDERKMITTFPIIKPAGESFVYIEVFIKPKFRVDPVNAQADTLAALLELGKFENSDINKAIRLSDLYAIVDNLIRIDYLNINFLALRPYARPINNNSTELVWEVLPTVNSNSNITWRLRYLGSNTFQVFKAGVLIGTATINTLFTESTIEFTILPGSYTLGETWEFINYRVNKDIEVSDFSVPIINSSNVSITY